VNRQVHARVTSEKPYIALFDLSNVCVIVFKIG
jgi:hypothetical protein